MERKMKAIGHEQPQANLNYLFNGILFLLILNSFLCGLSVMDLLIQVDADIEPLTLTAKFLVSCGVPILFLLVFSKKLNFQFPKPILISLRHIKHRILKTLRHWPFFLIKYFGFSGLIAALLFLTHSEISYGSPWQGLQAEPQTLLSYWGLLTTLYVFYGYILFIASELILFISRFFTQSDNDSLYEKTILYIFKKGFYVSIIGLLIRRFTL